MQREIDKKYKELIEQIRACETSSDMEDAFKSFNEFQGLDDFKQLRFIEKETMCDLIVFEVKHRREEIKV